mmetsp:Transcript_42088/g.130364  ORF Transcript_42088/g.130364 Transcript_42088/m.130364 type:complete len:408 (-) Transcript_42088:108-1331(-)
MAGPMRRCLTAMVAARAATVASAAAAAALAPLRDPRTCKGYERQYKDCSDLPKCYACEPVDCAFSEWGDWFEGGGCTGVCFRHRSIATSNNECGAPCGGLKQETKRCLSAACVRVPQDCQFGDWGQWSECAEGDFTAQKVRSRRIALHPRHGGAECSGATNETLPCGKNPAVDCALSEWAEWTECSASCGGGQQARSREVLQQPQGGGRGCNESLASTRGCHAGACAAQCELVDCTWGHWGEWSACDKCGGERKRFRFVSRQARCGGRPCKPGAAEEVMNCTRSCHSPSYCAFGDWHVWSSCSAECGSGVRSRLRQLRLAPLPVQFRKLERQEAPAHDAKEPGEAALQAKFQELHRQSKATELHRLQELVAAFAGGLVSLTVVLALARALLRRRPRRDMVAVPTAAE